MYFLFLLENKKNNDEIEKNNVEQKKSNGFGQLITYIIIAGLLYKYLAK